MSVLIPISHILKCNDQYTYWLKVVFINFLCQLTQPQLSLASPKPKLGQSGNVWSWRSPERRRDPEQWDLTGCWGWCKFCSRCLINALIKYQSKECQDTACMLYFNAYGYKCFEPRTLRTLERCGEIICFFFKATSYIQKIISDRNKNSSIQSQHTKLKFYIMNFSVRTREVC